MSSLFYGNGAYRPDMVGNKGNDSSEWGVSV
jgi:hypothetical protein